MTDTPRDTAPESAAAGSSGTNRSTETLSLPLRPRELSPKAVTRFHLAPSPEARADLSTELGVLKIRKLDFKGEIAAQGRHDWRLTGQLGATVVQACVITAEPVTTRLDLPVVRLFLRDMPQPTEAEAEMPDDDTIEPLGAVIDPGAVMAEALALALPDYPRADGAALPDSATPDSEDERPNPFAALAALKKDMGESD